MKPIKFHSFTKRIRKKNHEKSGERIDKRETNLIYVLWRQREEEEERIKKKNNKEIENIVANSIFLLQRIAKGMGKTRRRKKGTK